MTNVKTTGHPIDRLDFPAITICGLGMIEATLYRAYAFQIGAFLESKNVTPNWNDTNEDWREAAEDYLIETGLFDDFIEELYPGEKILY